MTNLPITLGCSYDECNDYARVVVKPHYRSATLLAPDQMSLCNGHLWPLLRDLVEHLEQDDDLHGITVVLA